MPSRVPTSVQMALRLDGPSALPTITVPEEAVSALADLLLAAIGRNVDAAKEGSDEQQDHR